MTSEQHLIIAIADHFEPAIMPGDPARSVDLASQVKRLERWCTDYPAALHEWTDDDGRWFQRTYFIPAEQYNPRLTDTLSEHCRAGWGEIEIHLHHGVDRPDTPENTQRVLAEFRDTLVTHGCLSRTVNERTPRFAFVHGNWALANSAGGRFCGVDEELAILSELGCYADFTLPSAPDRSQVRMINKIYECKLPLARRSAHRSGRPLAVGRPPETWPLIVQGPLGFNFERRIRGMPVPQIENSAITTAYPATGHRLELWRSAGIGVSGLPQWVFIKLHCHGMDPRDQDAMYGSLQQEFLAMITERARAGEFGLHFVTAREMVNIALAACDGLDGDPGDYRDYRFRLITPREQPRNRPPERLDSGA